MSLRRVSVVSAFVVLSLALCAAGGARSSGRTVEASWYGPGLYGHRMACGGVLTAATVGVAHRWLRCGSRLTVCYVGRCSRALVVDRGPYVAGRELDLTGALATRLRFSGVGRVYCSGC